MIRPGSPRRLLFGATFLLSLVLAAGGCAPKTPPIAAPGPAPTAPAAATPSQTPVAAPAPAPTAAPRHTPAEDLKTALDAIFGAPAFDRMQWAVVVRSLSTGETLYRANAAKLMMPASNMKIVTLAAAAERLGWDFTYETRLVTFAPVVGGVLRGDLVAVGSGDPTIGSRGGPSTRVFEDWADKLRALGITEIRGRVVAQKRLVADLGHSPVQRCVHRMCRWAKSVCRA